MSLTRLEITNFRNLDLIKLDPIPTGFNFFYGDNGSGKTSLLEAAYYLSRGRSFRSSTISHVINNAADKFSIFALINSQYEQTTSIGVERPRRGEARLRIAGQESSSMAELAYLTPTLLMNSNCYNLLDAGPVFRRKYLDWGAFYLTSDFLRLWKHYERALKQRNAALRERLSRKEIESWTIELIQHGTQLSQVREMAVEQLLPFLQAILTELLGFSELKIHYQPGWDETLTFQEALTQSIDKDCYAGFTQVGPHRADLKMTIDQVPVKDILSRGQQKLFVCAMILAQGSLLQQGVNRKPIYLVDDLPSELDAISRSNLIALLARQEAQIFLTAVEREPLMDSLSGTSSKMFHVERGNVKEALS